MSQATMNDRELSGFLSQPLLADIVTLKKDGSPQITPVDCYFDGTHLYFSTTTDRAKCRNIKRDNRIAVSIRNENARKVVLFTGTAESTTYGTDPAYRKDSNAQDPIKS